MILRWRKIAREILGIEVKDDAKTEIEVVPLTERGAN